MTKSIESKQKINYFSRNREMFDKDFKTYCKAPQRVIGKSNILRSFCGVFVFREMRKNKIKCYGGVAIPSAYCSNCKRVAFVIDNKIQCCGKMIQNVKYDGYERISEDDGLRYHIPDSLKKKILDEQEFCCFYCLMPFNFEVERKGKIIKREIEFDHLVPFSFINNDKRENLVASCNVCNRLKSSMCFQTVDEARVYLQERRESKGYNF